jgi:hypothetical protein
MLELIPRQITVTDPVSGVTFWRYSLPPEDGHLGGWGIFILDSTGMFTAVTDYGNYAFRWTATGCSDFRCFFPGTHGDYLLGKVAQREYDGKATLANIRRYLNEAVESEAMTEERAAEERELLERLHLDELETACDFREWLEDTSITDAYELAVEDYTAEARCFAERLFPRLVEAITAQLKAEEATQP